jgi:hypothetical protein
MKAIATVSMYDMGAANRDGLRKGVPLEQRKAILKLRPVRARHHLSVDRPTSPPSTPAPAMPSVYQSARKGMATSSQWNE